MSVAALCEPDPPSVDEAPRVLAVVALVSLLHESADRNSATRAFRGEPVLRHTLRRVSGAGRVVSVAVLCWDDQQEAVAGVLQGVEPLDGDAGFLPVRVAEEWGSSSSPTTEAPGTGWKPVSQGRCSRPIIQALSQGPRHTLPAMEAISAARRWADGWRGGLLGTCDFDPGFHAQAVLDAAKRLGADAVLLIDPAAGLVDPQLLDAVVAHAEANRDEDICFAPAAPGLAGVLLRLPLVERLARANLHPGRVLHYHPDVLSREPLAGRGCVPMPTPVARALGRFTLGSERQIARLTAATSDATDDDTPRRGDACVARPSASIGTKMTGSPVGATPASLDRSQGPGVPNPAAFTRPAGDAGVAPTWRGTIPPCTPPRGARSRATQASPLRGEALVRRVQSAGAIDALPRDVVLELNTSRLSRPIFWPGRHHPIERPDFGMEWARRIFAELATLDDTRLTLAGVGDPLLCPDLFDVIAAARGAGLAVNVETDLLAEDADAVRRLAATGADVVSVHVPALTEATYVAVMGVSGYRRVLENIQAFVSERARLGRGVPLVAPVFTKCRENLAEMEPWYDQWLRAVGSAVVVGPTDCGGLVPDVSVGDMAPPLRVPCRRLASRMTILSDGRIVSCEQDVRGRQVLGGIGEERLREVWARRFAVLRGDHQAGRWGTLPVCSACREWHRP